MIYLMFNEGYSATAGSDRHIQVELCDEAIRLVRRLTMLAGSSEDVLSRVILAGGGSEQEETPQCNDVEGCEELRNCDAAPGSATEEKKRRPNRPRARAYTPKAGASKAAL